MNGPVQCRVYVGETHNSSFAGGTPMKALAKLMYGSVGPSGPNKVSGSAFVLISYSCVLCFLAARSICTNYVTQ